MSAGGCLDEDTLQAFCEGALASDSVAAVESHIDGCGACRALVAALGRAAVPSLTPPTSPGDRPNSTTLAPGARVDRYVVGECVGAGAMGTVYAARDPELDRDIALKVVHAGPGRRVLREAKAIARLSHPNVVAIYDVGPLGDDVFIAMELADGSLRDWLRAAPRSWREVLDVFVQAGRGLAAAHAVGLVHRDFKPDNVLVDRQGRVRVADFGLARVAEDPAAIVAAAPIADAAALAATMTQTRGGSVVGTPAYMPPEQMRGAPADARSDVFSYCVALHEALYGERPFAGGSMIELGARIAHGEVRPAPEGSSVPAWLRAVVLRGLAADPGARWPSMDALLEALRVPAEGPPRARSPRRRALGWGAAILATAAAVAGVAALARLTGSRGAPAPSASAATTASADFDFRPSRLRRVTFAEECEEFPAFAPDGRHVFYDGAHGDDTLVHELDLSTGATRVVTRGPGADLAPRVSPDGLRVAYYRGDVPQRGTYVARVDGTGEPLFLGRGLAHASWTPDGRGVWAGLHAAPTLFDAETGKTLKTFEGPGKGYTAGFSFPRADGSLLLAYPQIGAAPGGGIARYTPEGERTWLLEGPLEDAAALSPDGRFIFYVRATETNDRELMVAPLDGSAPPRSLMASGIKPTKGIAFSPDGGTFVWSTCRAITSMAKADEHDKLVAMRPAQDWDDHGVTWIPGTNRAIVADSTRGGSSQPWVLDMKNESAPAVLDTGGVGVEAVAMGVSPDGRTVAFVGDTGGIFVMPTEGGAPRRVSDARSAWPPSFSHDGRHVFVAATLPDGASQIVSIAVDGSGQRAILEPGAVTPAACPTRPLLVYAQQGGAQAARVLDLTTGKKRLLSSELPRTYFPRAQFSPDGKRVALSTNTDVYEVDVDAGKVLRHIVGGHDAIYSLTYVDALVVVTRSQWLGDLWAADLGR